MHLRRALAYWECRERAVCEAYLQGLPNEVLYSAENGLIPQTQRPLILLKAGLPSDSELNAYHFCSQIVCQQDY